MGPFDSAIDHPLVVDDVDRINYAEFALAENRFVYRNPDAQVSGFVMCY